ALGSVATQSLLATREPIGKLRGRVHPYGSAVLIPTFHPAFLLRNPGESTSAWRGRISSSLDGSTTAAVPDDSPPRRTAWVVRKDGAGPHLSQATLGRAGLWLR